MPTPREIALATNAGIEPVTEDQPPEIKGNPREDDYRANPTNPDDGPPPASNLKK